MAEHDSQQQIAFPKLDDAQVAALAEFATRRRFHDGEPLFQAGERVFGFFVVLSGAVEILNTRTGETRTVWTPAVFTFIGAVPRTDWLPTGIETDPKGFVRTGRAVAGSPRWNAGREPLPLETSHPGVFAAGDVRLGSVKRVASAVGEGSAAVTSVHEYLADG